MEPDKDQGCDTWLCCQVAFRGSEIAGTTAGQLHAVAAKTGCLLGKPDGAMPKQQGWLDQNRRASKLEECMQQPLNQATCIVEPDVSMFKGSESGAAALLSSLMERGQRSWASCIRTFRHQSWKRACCGQDADWPFCADSRCCRAIWRGVWRSQNRRAPKLEKCMLWAGC